MSQPPPYNNPAPTNPDTRTLPPGWVQQYDTNYNAWFYVDTTKTPPVTTWTHPLGPPPPAAPPPTQYSPPASAPPPQILRIRWWRRLQPRGLWRRRICKLTPASAGLRLSESQMYQQAPAKKSGMGMGGMLAAGGAGLLGGVLLADALDDDNDHGDYDDGGDW
ncbi:hypothetical protein BD779DRAFT_869456 [Infundibulicybe gibba]|nr:hypothetical protein BD779DRAFT_869456 [Infundibulicybe gibba]